jgi:hypothetical protein
MADIHQQQAIALGNTKKNIIITGDTNSGKTWVFRQKGQDVPPTPDGPVTSYDYQLVQDMHRPFKLHVILGIGLSEHTNPYVLFQLILKKKPPLFHICKMDEVLYVEEAFRCPGFMIALLFALIEHYARMHNRKPLQLILIGDPFKCRPILYDAEASMCPNAIFTSDSFIMAHLQPSHCELDIIHSNGACETTRMIMAAARRCNWSPTSLDRVRHYVYTGSIDDVVGRMVILVATNKQVDVINADYIKQFEKITTIIATYPDDAIEFAENSIEIAIGMCGICTRSYTKGSNQYYNGEMVTVLAIGKVSENEGGPLPISMDAKASKFIILRRASGDTFKMSPKKNEAGVWQYDLQPGIAITIYRSQGMTLHNVMVDLNYIRTHGVLYTAMSHVCAVGTPSDEGSHVLGDEQHLALINFNEEHLVDKTRHLDALAVEFDERGVRDTPAPHKLHSPTTNCMICMCTTYSLQQ